ncbi:hypothetical protein NUW54_g5549 [Trametes sanguinea]|uniref:Uncharacterized protein n=1 Tax=Trametes sanguinea TaxID=158606 RepID=A0ACC1PUU5_9APHY|nr:hypothetical protein NUW54_g5549 [Trametes sanguinea]
MLAFITVVSSALALATSVAADFIPVRTGAHIFSSQSTHQQSVNAAASGAILVVTLPGDGSSDDITALYPLNGSGVPTPIVHDGLCITSRGVVPESSSQILYFAECDPSDSAQYWTINADPPTISNVDGNCITLGRAANGVSVVLDFCNDELQHLQLWDPKPISA